MTLKQWRGLPSCPSTPPLDKRRRARQHRVAAEGAKLLEAAKSRRNAARDRCVVRLMFRHGLRVSEACGLQLAQVDIARRVLHVARLTAGLSTTPPLRGDELRMMKRWVAARARMTPDTDACFLSEPRRPLRRKTAWRMIRASGQRAKPARRRPPTQAPPGVRLRPRRSGRRHAAHAGLSSPQRAKAPMSATSTPVPAC